ncbi:hypothetical protein FB45DRAFT_864810 [Roridomyces roridus]|uniref:Glycosyltransferase family 25 protein n=1 Tax=Roridomyces roridus TaxID=1738132 RepID=A0AAD7C3M2_9AGAR|nr:hypothetical protein FB45DRAFT_864810 [Roridomyces roridus]
MAAIPSRVLTLVLVIALTTLICLSILVLEPGERVLSFLDRNSPPAQVPISIGTDRILPVPSHTYIVHLARRTDRRREMERLRKLLGVEWSYIRAEESDSPLIDQLMSGIRKLRTDALAENGYAGDKHNTTVSLPFTWPDDHARMSFTPFEKEDKSTPGDVEFLDDIQPEEEQDPMTCTMGDFNLTPYSPKLAEVRTLTRSRVACFRSHFAAIRHAATRAPDAIPHASLFFEDDIDMESDIQERLASVWPYLPADWDLVFLGHGWGNETRYAALGPPSPYASTHIHPSNAPLCTHAYALSAKGVQHVLRHLAYEPFAYSRPIDNALAWLIISGRIKSYSVAPSVVVQRKKDVSDVLKGVHYKIRYSWDHLDRGVLAQADAAKMADWN